MNKKVLFNLLLVLTIGFSACNKENNPIDENPYATLSQSEIVSLLDESWLKSLNAPEVRRIDTVRNFGLNSEGLMAYLNDVRLHEVNRNQKKSLEVLTSNDGSIRLFFYIDNLTEFSYIFESDMSEPIKRRTILGGYYWDITHYTSTANGYKRFTWSVEGRVFTGVEEQERLTLFYRVKLNENEQLISVEYTSDDFRNTGVFTTFFYKNTNPIFPEGFDKDDFIESE